MIDTLNQALREAEDKEWKVKKLQELINVMTTLLHVRGDFHGRPLFVNKLCEYKAELASLGAVSNKLDYDCGETLIGESGVDIDGYTIKYSPAESITYKERQIALLKAKIETNPQYKEEILKEIEQLESQPCDLDRGSKLFD